MKKIILITVLAFALSAFQTPAPMGYQPGDIAADFSLKNIDGKMVSKDLLLYSPATIVLLPKHTKTA
jgi:hypothetical protein